MEDRRPHVQQLTLWAAIRASVSAITDDFGRYLAVNASWLAIGLLVLVVNRLHIAATALLVVVVPTTAALGRMAAHSARDEVARLPQAREGLTHRWPAAFVLGVLQLVVMGFAWINLQVGLAAATLPLIAAGIVAAWVLLLASAVAVAAWPLLLDPDRDDVTWRPLLRLALGVVATRPGRILVVVLLEVVIVAISVQTVIGAVLLPSLGVLLAANAVIPVADALDGRGRGSALPAGGG